MLGEKLELNDIPFLFQEHTTVTRVIEPSNVLPVSQVVETEVGKDLLTEILRKGARELLAQAVEQEVQEWLSERSGVIVKCCGRGELKKAVCLGRNWS